MTCRELLDHLVDLGEGTLAPSLRAAVEQHLETCAGCRALVEDLRRIRHTAAALERKPVPPEAWARLEARLEQELMARGEARARRLSRRPQRAWLAAAAVLALAVGAGLWQLDRGAAPPAEGGRDAAAGNVGGAPTVESIEAELQLAASHYENAIKGLEQIANASDSPLDPAVMATLKENLAVIDRAIDESRVALRTSPQSQLAQENLFEAFRRKVSLLQDTVALMNEMRKGNEAGAARIVEGLNKS